MDYITQGRLAQSLRDVGFEVLDSHAERPPAADALTQLVVAPSSPRSLPADDPAVWTNVRERLRFPGSMHADGCLLTAFKDPGRPGPSFCLLVSMAGDEEMLWLIYITSGAKGAAQEEELRLSMLFAVTPESAVDFLRKRLTEKRYTALSPPHERLGEVLRVRVV